MLSLREEWQVPIIAFATVKITVIYKSYNNNDMQKKDCNSYLVERHETYKRNETEPAQ